MKSDVYFVKVESHNLPAKITALNKLFSAAGNLLGCKQDEIIPVKLTIGDSACVYNINPELSKVVVSYLKQKGAKPFIFDTCVIYKGKRQNAVDHLGLAQNKGFGYKEIGAHFIIADGLFGQDGKEFNTGSKYIHKIRVPSFVGMLESLIVLTHPTGHIVSGYAGAIKNVAMGMSCRATKQVQHSCLKPRSIEKKCTGCGCCVNICPESAITITNNKAYIDQSKCVGCGECLCACKFDAVFINWNEDAGIFCRRMVDVADFILKKFRRKFFINFAFDITKECDCISNKDEKMVSADIGILFSCDILSLDKATLDLALKNKKSSFLSSQQAVWEPMFEYAKDLGMGSLEYNLISL